MKPVIVCVYVFIIQQDNTQNIMPEGQHGTEALTAARIIVSYTTISNSMTLEMMFNKDDLSYSTPPKDRPIHKKYGMEHIAN